jgi:hypothetical protein
MLESWILPRLSIFRTLGILDVTHGREYVGLLVASWSWTLRALETKSSQSFELTRFETEVLHYTGAELTPN